MPIRKHSATIKDVAAHAGVSIKTVSNVVNDWPYVSDETRKKVWDAIEAVGYRPNHAARSLVTGKTRSIGVIIPDISNPFFGTAIRGCEDGLYESEYSLVLCNTNEDVEREKNNLEMLLSRGVDALILWGTRMCCEDLDLLISPQIPFVTVDLGDTPRHPGHTSIHIANQNGGYMATSHLVEQGFRRIAHLAGPEERATARRRQAGYTEALAFAGVPFDPNLVNITYPATYEGYQSAMQLISSQHPEAIFCYNDLVAVGVLLAANELGLKVPDDLAIVGFDDILLASLTEPPLTTVRIPQYEVGWLTGQIVLERLQSRQETPRQIEYPVELVVRSSSRKSMVTAGERRQVLANLVSTLPGLAKSPRIPKTIRPNP